MKFCKDCDFCTLIANGKIGICTHPLAVAATERDVVTGETEKVYCTVIRFGASTCGANAQWFVPKK